MDALPRPAQALRMRWWDTVSPSSPNWRQPMLKREEVRHRFRWTVERRNSESVGRCGCAWGWRAGWSSTSERPSDRAWS